MAPRDPGAAPRALRRVRKVLLNSWFQPPSTEYHLATVPPLILLLLLGPIAVRAEPSAGAGRRRAEAVIVVALVATLFLVDFRGGILPWLRYGQMRDALAARLHVELRPATCPCPPSRGSIPSSSREASTSP